MRKAHSITGAFRGNRGSGTTASAAFRSSHTTANHSEAISFEAVRVLQNGAHCFTIRLQISPQLQIDKGTTNPNASIRWIQRQHLVQGGSFIAETSEIRISRSNLLENEVVLWVHLPKAFSILRIASSQRPCRRSIDPVSA